MSDRLQKIREEWNQRPLEGVSPSEIEKKFPGKAEILEFPECEKEGCVRPSFRWQPFCRAHHLEWIEQTELENEARNKANFKRQRTKKYAEERARNAAISATSHCSQCGSFMAYVDKIAVLKPEKSRPKKPVLAHHIFKVVCSGCAKDK